MPPQRTTRRLLQAAAGWPTNCSGQSEPASAHGSANPACRSRCMVGNNASAVSTANATRPDRRSRSRRGGSDLCRRRQQRRHVKPTPSPTRLQRRLDPPRLLCRRGSRGLRVPLLPPRDRAARELIGAKADARREGVSQGARLLASTQDVRLKLSV